MSEPKPASKLIRQILQQNLSQKLTPRQIQLMKLIQLSYTDLELRINEELEVNPALEEENNDEHYENEYEDDYISSLAENKITEDDGYDLERVDRYDDQYYDNSSDDEVPELGNIMHSSKSFHDSIYEQLILADFSEQEEQILFHIVGSIEDAGYLRRTVQDITDELAFKQSIYVEEPIVAEMIKKIQELEPAGIGAFDLQECLLLQIKRKDLNDINIKNAQTILEKYYTDFTKKHYSKITSKMKITENDLKKAIEQIVNLSPKPGLAIADSDQIIEDASILPDFIAITENENVRILLNDSKMPKLRISHDFESLATNLKGDISKKAEKETKTFINKKMENARWFIDALQQRKNTLLRTMNEIAQHQKRFFLSGDSNDLKPLILKNIAEKIEMDISTISRVVKDKYVHTEYGVLPLKFFFTESYTNDDGNEVSVLKIKNLLSKIVEEEDKTQPITDEELKNILNKNGYSLARRTVAKYRDQLSIPVARLRKEI